MHRPISVFQKEISMKILVTLPDGAVRNLFLPPSNQLLLENLGDVLWNPGTEQFSQDELRHLLAKVDVVITGWGSPCIGEHVLSTPHPKMLAHTGGTIAPYVDRTTYEKGIVVVSANAVYAKSVAEGSLAYMLAGLRRLAYWDRNLRAGGWRTDRFTNAGLFEKKIGLIGFGTVTKYLIPLLKPFTPDIYVYSDHLSEEEAGRNGVKKSSLDEIFSGCDIISLHNALTPKTKHLINDSLLSRIPEGALLINTARGGIIDEVALIKQLETNRFQAVLDVFSQEPLALDSPLRRLENVTIIPHMAGPTTDMYALSGRAVIEDIQRWKEGKPLQNALSVDALSHMTAKG